MIFPFDEFILGCYGCRSGVLKMESQPPLTAIFLLKSLSLDNQVFSVIPAKAESLCFLNS
jgi:hypothetical protein